MSTPLQKAGVYLLTARMAGGNTSHIIVWLDDTVILKKPTATGIYYFIADSRTGEPVAGADIELFDWRMVQVPGKNQYRVDTSGAVLRSDTMGQVQVPRRVPAGGEQWSQSLCIARTRNGRFAHLGFSPAWGSMHQPSEFNETKVYTITDRPVYRPGQPVKFKCWVARARYEHGAAEDFAHRTFPVEIHNPKGEKLLSKTFQTDAFGGFDGSFELASDAALGVYQLLLPNLGGGTFRVEEYKKPEFEVKVDAPGAPVTLGEKVVATIKANYYFGAPVAEAKVRYKVTRVAADEFWYPPARWDWLFGPGYWWFAVDAPWYPGWSRWGIARPRPWWMWSGPQGPPEVIAQAEVPIRPDGTFPIEIDTAPAQRNHPDQDQRYEIMAEVTDRSRRTIVGTGTVLVARQPFKVHTWLDRGHYRTGETIEASVAAETLDHKPVAGKGTLALLQVRYDATGKPVETPVERWDLALDANGRANQTIKASAPGQYRISATIDDSQGHRIEGGYLFTIRGEGFDDASFRYGDLEIIPDRKEYRPGDTLRLLIHTNQVNSTVLLFVRPAGGVYAPPRIVHLRGKSTVEEIGIVAGDMPNIFIEALTVSRGRVHTEARQIVVPPESRVVNVAVEPSATTYKPGQKARVRVKLTGSDGKPFVGSTALTVYDKSVEAIAGGSNVGDIKSFFWSWRRSHHPYAESSLDRRMENVIRQNEIAMQVLGVPDQDSTYDVAALGDQAAARDMGRMAGLGGMGGGMNLGRRARMFAAAAPAGYEKSKSASPQWRGEADRLPAGAVISSDSFEGDAAPAPAPVQPVVRTNFADTAFWAPALVSTADGTAEVEFTIPESLTTWKVKAWTLGKGTRVGQGDAEVITTKNLLVRLQAPRFFVQKDEVVLSANVHNKLKSRKTVQVVLGCEGSVLEMLDVPARSVEIAAGGEQRVDWRVKVLHEGQAIVVMKALTDEESDAAQMSFPAKVHGMLKTEAVAGSLAPTVKGPRSRCACPRNAGPSSRGSRCATRPRSPAPWWMPCPTWPTIRMAAPNKR